MELQTKKQQASAWFKQLRDEICNALEAVENDLTRGEFAALEAGKFTRKPWNRETLENPSAVENHTQGGGEISLLKGGRVFEKAGVNISEVYGEFSEKFRNEIPNADADPRFWAAGISLVIHPRSPKIPAVHMNTRMIVTGDNAPWFGGGADLTPMIINAQDSVDFHAAWQNVCLNHGQDYARYKAWCDEYFFLPHRNEPRGIGGIFYDYLKTDWQKDFAFTQAVGREFIHIYPEIARRHMNESWSEAEREAQLYKRGRYVEFNLLQDRGTRFGIMTGGNTEAILMSMPPVVKW